MGNAKQEHKHLIKWLEREREVSKQAKFEQEYLVKYEPKVYGMGFEVNKDLAPNDWYVMQPDMLVVPRHLEEKAANLFNAGFKGWNFTYGSFDPESDPLQDAINRAVQELR